jgi:hypothetical protein
LTYISTPVTVVIKTCEQQIIVTKGAYVTLKRIQQSPS